MNEAMGKINHVQIHAAYMHIWNIYHNLVAGWEKHTTVMGWAGIGLPSLSLREPGSQTALAERERDTTLEPERGKRAVEWLARTTYSPEGWWGLHCSSQTPLAGCPGKHHQHLFIVSHGRGEPGSVWHGWGRFNYKEAQFYCCHLLGMVNLF